MGHVEEQYEFLRIVLWLAAETRGMCDMSSYHAQAETRWVCSSVVCVLWKAVMGFIIVI
jgi:hypothetical protein